MTTPGSWPLLGRPFDSGLSRGGDLVKEEASLGDRGDKRKLEDFSSLYSLEPPVPPPPHSVSTPPRSLPDHNGESDIIHYTKILK